MIHTPESALPRPEMWRRGTSHMAAGRWREAIAWFSLIAEPEDASDIDRFSAPARLQLSSACLRLDEYRNARQHALRAAAIRPLEPTVLQGAVNALSFFNEPERMASLADECATQVELPPVLVDLARVLSSFGMHERAMALLDRSDAMTQENAQARSMRGLVHMFQGRSRSAEIEFRRSLELEPEAAHVHWFLSQVSQADIKQAHCEKIRDLLQRELDGSTEGYLAYALHNELHDLQRYDEAWAALERGFRAKKRSVPYDPATVRHLFAALKTLCTPQFVQAGAIGQGHFTPIFIVGMHRSGTTLLERILGGHSQITDGGESYDFIAQLRLAADHHSGGVLDLETVRRLADADFAGLGLRYLEAARWRAGNNPFLTEKLPSNFINAGFIAKAIPHAKILHVTRDAADTCFSNLRTHFAQAAAYSYDQIEVADYYAEYRELMRHWRSVMPDRLLEVPYGDLVRSPEAVAREVFAFCGLPFEAGALEVDRESGSVATASSTLVRGGIRTDRGAAWKHYERHLQPLLGRLRQLGLA